MDRRSLFGSSNAKGGGLGGRDLRVKRGMRNVASLAGCVYEFGGLNEISCKVDGIAVGLKACFMKKA